MASLFKGIGVTTIILAPGTCGMGGSEPLIHYVASAGLDLVGPCDPVAWGKIVFHLDETISVVDVLRDVRAVL